MKAVNSEKSEKKILNLKKRTYVFLTKTKSYLIFSCQKKKSPNFLLRNLFEAVLEKKRSMLVSNTKRKLFLYF